MRSLSFLSWRRNRWWQEDMPLERSSDSYVLCHLLLWFYSQGSSCSFPCRDIPLLGMLTGKFYYFLILFKWLHCLTGFTALQYLDSLLYSLDLSTLCFANSKICWFHANLIIYSKLQYYIFNGLKRWWLSAVGGALIHCWCEHKLTGTSVEKRNFSTGNGFNLIALLVKVVSW